MLFPRKDYDHLHTLGQRWDVPQDDVYYAVENGWLRACIWLPLRYIERGIIQEGGIKFVQHEMREGFIGIRPVDFRLIRSTGRCKLRIFHSVKNESDVLRLAYEPPQPSVNVRIADLVVLKADLEKFEGAHRISQHHTAAKKDADEPEDITQFSNDYRHVLIGGHEYHLGDVQARVIERLHDAARSLQPWVHGKTLLDEAGSQAEKLRDVFKHQQEWRDLIASNKRGYYRLNVPLQERTKHANEAAAEY